MAYIGGVCSIGRGVGVNEVRLIHEYFQISSSKRFALIDLVIMIEGCLSLFFSLFFLFCLSVSLAAHGRWLPLCPRAWHRIWASSGTLLAGEVCLKLCHTPQFFYNMPQGQYVTLI